MRSRFNAIITRFADKPSFAGHVRRAMLLQDVRNVETGRQTTNEAWLSCGKYSADLSLGDTIEFNATVTRNRFSRPAKVKKINQPVVHPI